MTGSVTACFAAELGCRVLLLDAAQDATAGGNTTLSGGAFHLARTRYDADPAVLREKLLMRAILPRIELIDVIANTAGEGLAWLIEQGLEFLSTVPGDLEFMLAPLRDLGDVHAWRDRGPQVALRTLQAKLRSHGGEILAGTRAVELARGPAGEIAGVVTEDGQTLSAGAVMLADGGFQANLELRRRFIAPNADRMFLRGAPNSIGNGLMMAESAGAKLLNTEWFYGHILHRDVLHNDRLWPWPGLDELIPFGGILVDAHGKRFVDEGRGPTILVNAIGRSEDPRATTLILDQRMWDASAGEQIYGHRAANPELVERGGRIFRADTVDDLASQAQHRRARTPPHPGLPRHRRPRRNRGQPADPALRHRPTLRAAVHRHPCRRGDQPHHGRSHGRRSTCTSSTTTRTRSPVSTPQAQGPPAPPSATTAASAPRSRSAAKPPARSPRSASADTRTR